MLFAPVVKWISQRSSEPLLRVRILPGAQELIYLSFYFFKRALFINSIFTKTVDNYVYIVYKGQVLICLF